MVGTQQFVDIKKIENGVAFLKNGSLCQILAVEGINFDLKSEQDQSMLLYAFQNFLNTLNFSLQIVVRSRKLNISPYLKNLEQKEKEETNELLKTQLREYQNFIKNFVAENSIIEKKFFVVISYTPIIIPAKKGILSKILPNFPQGKKVDQEQKTNEQEWLFQLNQRVEQVMVGLNQIGLSAIPLDNKTTIELFYNLYNPKSVEKKELKISEEY